MSHVLSLETGLVVQRLMHIEDREYRLMFKVRWRGLPESEDTIDTTAHIDKDVPQLLLELLGRKHPI